MTFVCLAIFLVGDDLVLVRLDLSPARIERGGRVPFVGMQRKTREQPLEIGTFARRTRRGRVLRPDQRLELAIAAAAMEVVEGD